MEYQIEGDFNPNLNIGLMLNFENFKVGTPGPKKRQNFDKIAKIYVGYEIKNFNQYPSIESLENFKIC